jgi:DNA-binding MarR family transcriptional regulator
MVNCTLTKPRRKFERAIVPVIRSAPTRTLGAHNGCKDLFVFRIFQTCLKLQTSLDRRFLKYGMTLQEANVLLLCVQAQKITPGKLALVLGRDKGKITRFIDRLESGHLITREVYLRDRRCSVLKPTGKGKQVARALTSVFESIRKELFIGILERDVHRLGQILAQLHKNATKIGSLRDRGAVRQRRRIGTHGRKRERTPTQQPQLMEATWTGGPDGRAANSLPAEGEGDARQLGREEKSSEEMTDPIKVTNEHKELVLK